MPNPAAPPPHGRLRAGAARAIAVRVGSGDRIGSGRISLRRPPNTARVALRAQAPHVLCISRGMLAIKGKKHPIECFFLDDLSTHARKLLAQSAASSTGGLNDDDGVGHNKGASPTGGAMARKGTSGRWIAAGEEEEGPQNDDDPRPPPLSPAQESWEGDSESSARGGGGGGGTADAVIVTIMQV